MSELTITHNNIAQTAKAGASVKGGVIARITPTVIAGTTENNDVMFNATEIPNAVLERGGVSRLVGITIVDKDNEQHDMDLIFMQVQTNFGTAGAASTITRANLEACKVIGSLPVDFSDSTSVIALNSGSACIYTASSLLRGATSSSTDTLPILLQAESNSTSVYFTALVREEAAYAAPDDLEFVFHIEYMD